MLWIKFILHIKRIVITLFFLWEPTNWPPFTAVLEGLTHTYNSLGFFQLILFTCTAKQIMQNM